MPPPISLSICYHSPPAVQRSCRQEFLLVHRCVRRGFQKRTIRAIAENFSPDLKNYLAKITKQVMMSIAERQLCVACLHRKPNQTNRKR